MIESLLNQIQQQSLLEVFAVVFAVLYVVFAARQNILCWPSALISTGIYVYIFWEVMLPFQSVLNIYYLVIAVYGWLHWRRLAEEGDALRVTRWSPQKHLVWLLAMALASVLCIRLVDSWIESDYLMLDGVLAIYSCLATYLMAKKILENWLYWVVLNSGAAYLYFSQGLYLTTLLFCFYCGYAVIGWLKWYRSYQSWQLSATAN
ncbi:MAG: nicotinamide riboside transporter PnuC [Aestuariibacter sp.]